MSLNFNDSSVVEYRDAEYRDHEFQIFFSFLVSTPYLRSVQVYGGVG